MLNLKKYVRNRLLSDPILQGLVDSKIYLAYKPIANSSNDFPQITLIDDDGPSRSYLEVYDIRLVVHIWAKDPYGQTTAERIAERVNILLDKEELRASDFKCYRLEKESSPLLFEDDSQTYHKTVHFTAITRGYKWQS